MAFSESMTDLEQLIGDAMSHALEGARRALAEQIRRRSELDVHEARGHGLRDLRDATARLDAAQTQAEVLSTLLEVAGRFAGRTALLLTFAGEARGWGAYGFGGGAESIEHLRLPYDEPALRRLAEGRGAVALTAEEARALCRQLGGDAPAEGLLVPLVLRDRVAAALYADRTQAEQALVPAALQLLAFSASQLLELLGQRERAATPTLLGIETAAAASSLALWDPEAMQAETATSAEAARPASAPAPAAPSAPPAPAAVATTAPETPASAEPTVEEPAAISLPETPEPKWEEPAPAPVPFDETAMPEGAWELEEAPTASTATPLAAEEPWVYTDQGYTEAVYEESAAAEELPLDTSSADSSLPAIEEVSAEPMEEPTASWRTPHLPPPDATSTSQLYPQAPGFPSEATVRISRDLLPATPPPMAAEQDVSDDSTVMLHRPALAPPPAPTPAAPPRAAAPPPPQFEETPTRAASRPAPVFGGGGGSSTEVQPPPDLEGPGWAFRSTEPANTAPQRQINDETSALHEEARRLARLLVSEIKLYNEEQVEEGRRQRDIYPRLQEDIDRSRQMYDDRVDPRVRGEVDYFHQEMVTILAGGDAGALGM